MTENFVSSVSFSHSFSLTHSLYLLLDLLLMPKKFFRYKYTKFKLHINRTYTITRNKLAPNTNYYNTRDGIVNSHEILREMNSKK